MSESLKEKQTSVTENNPGKSSNPIRRVNLLLIFIALVATVALFVLGLFLFFDVGNNKTPTTPSATRPRTPAAPFEGIDQPAPADFGIPAAPGPTTTPLRIDDEAARLRLVADEYLLQGRPVEAAAQYRLVLDKYPTGLQTQAALYGLARSSVERARYSEAADFFKKYLATYPNDPLRTNCYYYLGLIDQELGYWDEAISFFQKYQAEQPGQMVLDGYAWFEIAEAYSNALKPSQALEAYKKAGSSAASNLLRVTAMEKVGDAYLKENNPVEGAVWYGKILELAKVPEYRAKIIGKQARAYDAAKQSDKAVELTRLLVNDYLDTTDGFTTLRSLFNLNSPVLDDYLKGYYLLRANNTTGAIEAFNRFLGRTDDKAPQPPTPTGANKETQNRLGRAWFYLATLYEAKNDLNRAGAEYRDLVARFPQAPAAPDALWRLAKLTERQNNPDEASKLYGQFVERYPAEANADEAIYLQMRLGLAKGPEVAQTFADTLAQKYPGSNRRTQAFYEVGRAYQAKNDAAGARRMLQKAAESPQADFYAVRAGERLVDAYDPNQPPRSNPVSHPAVYSPRTFAADLERDRQTMDSWLTTWASSVVSSTNATPVVTPKALELARQQVNNDPGLKRLVALRAVGRGEQVGREAKEAFDRYYDKPIELYALALNLSEQGEYYYSISAAKRILELYRQKNPSAGLRNVPLLLQKLIYPLPYQSIILEQSRRYDFDPLLMVSLLKQESVFEPGAISSAGAMGLAQVMPDTGKGIAGNLDKPNFKPEDLLRPYTAIEFGSFYLATRLKDFDGNPYQALAAYNGGAGNVYRWNKVAPSDHNFDNWLANIDFSETRGYVQIIYANYYLYRQIYAAN